MPERSLKELALNLYRSLQMGDKETTGDVYQQFAWRSFQRMSCLVEYKRLKGEQRTRHRIYD